MQAEKSFYFDTNVGSFIANIISQTDRFFRVSICGSAN
jgi:hypothetical protein